MALSVTKRPKVQKIGTAAQAAQIQGIDSPLKAYVFHSGHGISTGSVIYVRSSIENYSGFFKAEVFDSSSYYLNTNDELAQRIPAIDDKLRAIEVFGCDNLPAWNCVHLPIVYKLTSTLWPTNSADTARTVSSFTDDNGYVNLNLSGDIKASGSANELEWVEISGSNGIDGVYQIINWISDSDITINLEYSAGYSFTGATVQYYYNNYHALIRIYAGLKSDHIWVSEKPYELVATIKAVPDPSGVIQVNIAEELKAQIEIISNNLQLGTLPHNLDAFCMFYIEYAESYDDSNGYTLGTFTSAFTSDQSSFEGKAVNADLPFKNIYSGSMSDYVLNSGVEGKFLTNNPSPLIFTGKYFDLSFIWDGAKNILFKQEWYLNGVLQTTEYNEVEEAFYTSVFRHQILGNCAYDRVDVTAFQYSRHPIPVADAWTISSGAWTVITKNQFSLTDAVFPPGPIDSTFVLPESIPSGSRVTMRITLSCIGTLNGTMGIACVFTDNPATIQVSNIVNANVSPGQTQTFEMVFITTGIAGIFQMTAGVIAGSSTATSGTVNPFTVTIEPYYHVEDAAISETKQIEVNCSCYSEYIYLTWLNNLGGYDYWLFTGGKAIGTDILSETKSRKDYFGNWPKSYGEFVDTIDHVSSRKSKRTYLVRSQPLTKAQVMAISEIKSSPLVQIMSDEDGWDRRTVLVDTDSIVIMEEMDKLHSISFTISLTDELPAQSQ